MIQIPSSAIKIKTNKCMASPMYKQPSSLQVFLHIQSPFRKLGSPLKNLQVNVHQDSVRESICRREALHQKAKLANSKSNASSHNARENNWTSQPYKPNWIHGAISATIQVIQAPNAWANNQKIASDRPTSYQNQNLKDYIWKNIAARQYQSNGSVLTQDNTHVLYAGFGYPNIIKENIIKNQKCRRIWSRRPRPRCQLISWRRWHIGMHIIPRVWRMIWHRGRWLL